MAGRQGDPGGGQGGGGTRSKPPGKPTKTKKKK